MEDKLRLKKDPLAFKKTEDEKAILKLQKKEYRRGLGTSAHNIKREEFISAFVGSEVPNWNVKFIVL